MNKIIAKNKKLKTLSFSLIALLGFTQSSLSQNTITIDPTIQRFIGNVSQLDKSKYVQGHYWFANKPNDPDFIKFKQDYNIDSNYQGSRSFWNPVGTIKNGNIPQNINNKYDGTRELVNYVATGKAGSLFHDKNIDYSQTNVLPFTKDMATYTAQSFKDSWEFVPTLYEPFNEPMVHAPDYYPENFSKTKNDIIITKISEFHREMGKAIHAVPELNKMKVMGYASAFPEFENKDFRIWNNQYKKFIDIAGQDLDAFSVHIYDGVGDGAGINSNGGRRSGSNSEAILDLIEAYSYEKLNTVKPYAVTEYGRLVASQPGWEPGNGVSNFEPVENARAVRSQIHLTMSFMERGSKMLSAIPFTVGKSNRNAKFSRACLFIKNSDGSYDVTPRKYFYEVWKDVKGKRVFNDSENIDVQTQAFVSGNKMYVILNNLNDAKQTVTLNTVNTPAVNNVHIKRLKIFSDKVPQLNNTTVNSKPTNIDLEYGETVVLTYNFDSNITFNNKVTSKKYYANSTLKAINPNNNILFNVKNVQTGNGKAILRLSVGRDLGSNLTPTIAINNNTVNYSGDIIKGYNQANRRRFFGTLEIPFDINLLNSGTNTVTVKFPDNGGHISSVIINTELLDTPITTPTPPTEDVFYIINKKTNKKIRPIENTNHTLIVQAPANETSDWVKWKKVATQNGYFYLQNIETGKYFRPANTDDDSNFELKPTSYSGNFTQWKQVATNNEYFYLQNRETQKYFRPNSDDDLSDANGNNYNLIQKETSWSGNWTQWKFENVSTGNNILPSIQDRNNLLESNNLTSNDSFNIFPNPAKNVLNVHSDNAETVLNINLKNSQGKTLKSLTSKGTTNIDVSDLTGIYFIVIQSKDKTIVRKVIIE